MTGNIGCAGVVSPGPGVGGKVACPQSQLQVPMFALECME